MKKLLLILAIALTLSSCEDQGSAYQNPEERLSYEEMNTLNESCLNAAIIFDEDNNILIRAESGEYYKTKIFSESDLAVITVGSLILFLLVLFIIGVCAGHYYTD